MGYKCAGASDGGVETWVPREADQKHFDTITDDGVAYGHVGGVEETSP